MMIQQLIQKLAGSGAEGGMGPGADMPGAGASGAGDASAQLAQQFSQVNGADPELAVKTLMNIKGMLVAIFNQTVFVLPGVARYCGQAMKAIDSAIKDAQQAAQTTQTVRSQIQNNAALSMPMGMGSDVGGM